MSDQTNRLEQALIELADGAISTRQDLQELTGAVRLLQQSTERMQGTIADNEVRYQTRFEQIQDTVADSDARYQTRFGQIADTIADNDARYQTRLGQIQDTVADNDARYQARFEQMQSSLQAQNEATQARFTEVMEAVELVSRAASEAVQTSRANAERFETLRQDAIADRQAADQRHQDFIERFDNQQRRFDNQQRQIDATLETMQTMLVELSRTNGRVEALENAA